MAASRETSGVVRTRSEGEPWAFDVSTWTGADGDEREISMTPGKGAAAALPGALSCTLAGVMLLCMGGGDERISANLGWWMSGGWIGWEVDGCREEATCCEGIGLESWFNLEEAGSAE